MRAGGTLLAVFALLLATACSPGATGSSALPENGAAELGWGSSYDTGIETASYFGGEHTLAVRFMAQYERSYEGPLLAAVTTPTSSSFSVGVEGRQVPDPSASRPPVVPHLGLQGKLGVERDRRAGRAHDDRPHLRCHVGRRAPARPTRQRDHGHGRQRAYAPRHLPAPSLLYPAPQPTGRSTRTGSIGCVAY